MYNDRRVAIAALVVMVFIMAGVLFTLIIPGSETHTIQPSNYPSTQQSVSSTEVPIMPKMQSFNYDLMHFDITPATYRQPMTFHLVYPPQWDQEGLSFAVAALYQYGDCNQFMFSKAVGVDGENGEITVKVQPIHVVSDLSKFCIGLQIYTDKAILPSEFDVSNLSPYKEEPDIYIHVQNIARHPDHFATAVPRNDPALVYLANQPTSIPSRFSYQVTYPKKCCDPLEMSLVYPVEWDDYHPVFVLSHSVQANTCDLPSTDQVVFHESHGVVNMKVLPPQVLKPGERLCVKLTIIADIRLPLNDSSKWSDSFPLFITLESVARTS